eukprot:tig00001155_g7335.t1
MFKNFKAGLTKAIDKAAAATQKVASQAQQLANNYVSGGETSKPLPPKVARLSALNSTMVFVLEYLDEKGEVSTTKQPLRIDRYDGSVSVGGLRPNEIKEKGDRS